MRSPTTPRGILLGTLSLALLVPATPGAAGVRVSHEPTSVECVVPGWDDRCERWADRYNEGTGTAPFGSHNTKYAYAGALSPSGNRAFVTGSTVDLQTKRLCPGNPPTICQDMQTVAYDAASGSVLWAKNQAPPWENSQSLPRSVVVSSDGRTVFAIGTVFTGSGSATDTRRDVQIVAYDSATGALRWSKLYDGPAGRQDDAFAAAASPVDGRLFVAATSTSTDLPVFTNGYSSLYMHRGMMIAGLEVDTDMALLTFDGATGDLLGEHRYGGPTFSVDGKTHASWDVPTDIQVSPDARRIVIAGVSDGREAYRAKGVAHSTVVTFDGIETGWERRWVREVPGIPLGLGAFPAQDTVAFAGAFGQGGTASNPFAVVGLDAGTGAQRWETRYALGGTPSQTESPRALLADTERGLIHLPGVSRSSDRGTMGVLSLRAADGTMAWRTRLRDPRSNATIIFNYDADRMPVGTLDPVTGHVYVTSEREGNLATFSLNGATGAQRWVGLFDDPLRSGTYLEQSSYDWPMDMEAAGGRTVVFGNSYIPNRDSCPWMGPLSSPCSRVDFLTVAYDV